jgi:hypothetical protein
MLLAFFGIDLTIWQDGRGGVRKGEERARWRGKEKEGGRGKENTLKLKGECMHSVIINVKQSGSESA